jgi:hypothetical protein
VGGSHSDDISNENSSSFLALESSMSISFLVNILPLFPSSWLQIYNFVFNNSNEFCGSAKWREFVYWARYVRSWAVRRGRIS